MYSYSLWDAVIVSSSEEYKRELYFPIVDAFLYDVVTEFAGLDQNRRIVLV